MEVTILAQCQIFLRRHHLDAFAFDNAHYNGRSELNQTIEAWWSRQRRYNSQYWLDELNQLQDCGFWEPSDVVSRWILLYVYIPLLETELADLKMAYNAHKIRKQKGKLRPDGIPDDMYYFPDRFGGEEEGFVPSENDLQQIATQHALGRPLPDYIPDEVRAVATGWCRSHNVAISVLNASFVYKHLRQYFKDNINI